MAEEHQRYGQDALEQGQPGNAPNAFVMRQIARKLRQLRLDNAGMLARVVAKIQPPRRYPDETDSAQQQKSPTPADERQQHDDDRRGDRGREPRGGMREALREAAPRHRDPGRDHTRTGWKRPRL